MKHPVDTNAWGKFVVGELFDVQLSDGDNKPKKLPKGTIPLVSAGNTNNGIVGSFESDTIIFPAHSITIDMFGQAFYQPEEFQTVSHGRVNILVPNFENNENIGRFIVTILNAQCQKYSFTEMLTSKKIKAEFIKLPLKPSANRSNYNQTDIDWTYMEMVMSRVTEKAKERLASLSTPRSRSKTPVDTNAWGEFVVGELFDNVTRGTRLKKSDRKVGSTPLVTAGSENQGIAEHVLENKELFSGINLTIDMFGNVFARNYPFYADDNILVLKTNNRTFNQLQFMASSLAHLANEYGYTNQFRQNTLNNTTIKLPLKPFADPSNYTQEDIDWDYMGRFMQAIEEKAHERVDSLKERTNEDD